MDFSTWEPVYERILADFGYPRAADERARETLGGLTSAFDVQKLEHVAGATVAVAGGGPSLAAETDRVAAADVVVAASGAADVLRDAGVGVDCMVTDLDGNPGTARSLAASGVPVAIHAHGDNIPVLEEWVPRIADEWVLPTTQAAPAGPVRNFGGFTDGDRAAFLADHLGAAALTFAGWDFDDQTVTAEKARKLRWAERLLAWLERRRDERFAVLDGRRGRIDPLR